MKIAGNTPENQGERLDKYPWNNQVERMSGTNVMMSQKFSFFLAVRVASRMIALR
ncbi:MAG: hypothetical protein KTR15_07360 [Phycisphaeraceae bacterium]|nr:hypothetical protein [Phycisphaeraceae bacterium]